MKIYTIRIKWLTGETEEIQLKTSDIEKSMNQYSRNRKPFNWEIVKIQDL